MKGAVEDWATESLLAARQAYQVPETGKRIKSGTKLGDSYSGEPAGRPPAACSSWDASGVGVERSIS